MDDKIVYLQLMKMKIASSSKDVDMSETLVKATCRALVLHYRGHRDVPFEKVFMVFYQVVGCVDERAS